MTNESASSIFDQAAGFFVETLSRVGPQQWEQPGLGQWSVRDLVGHTSRSLLTVESYLGHPAGGEALAAPADYFVKALASIGDPQAVAQRGRDAGAALGADPIQAVRDIAARVSALVARSNERDLVGTPVGDMHLVDYLPTRT